MKALSFDSAGLPTVAATVGGTTPNPGTVCMAYSSVTGGVVWWNGSTWQLPATGSASNPTTVNCRAAIGSNIASLSTTSAIDGVALTINDLVLLAGQTTLMENGVYSFNGTGLVRSAAMGVGITVLNGLLVTATEGTINGDTLWMLTTNGNPIVGTNALTFKSFGTPGSVAYTTVLLDFGTTATSRTKAFSVSLTGLQIGVSIFINPSGNMPSGISFDESEFEAITYVAQCASTGVLSIIANSQIPIRGQRYANVILINTGGGGVPVIANALGDGVHGDITISGSSSVLTVTSSSSAIYNNANAMPALVIDVTKTLNTKSISADTAFTFSGTPGNANTWFGLRVTNTDTAPHILTLPSAFDISAQVVSTTTTISAGGRLWMVWNYDGSGYNLMGSGYGSGLPQYDANLAANNTYEGTVVAGRNAGATMGAWSAVYLDSTGAWQLADATGSGTYPVRGITIAAYSSGNSAKVLDIGVIRNDSWAWAIGGDIFLGTAGNLTQTAPSATGNKIQKVGYALSATSMRVYISPDYLTHA